jgi:dephospho-CoA kinase
MLKVGLTGSIAVGKTFVSNVFSELGCFVLDADKTAREVVEPGTEGWKAIVENFGNEVLQPDGTLDRAKLGAIVFSDSAKRELLNSIVHPLVFKAQDNWLKECELLDPRGLALIDAALMIESGSYKRFDKIIVVWCQPQLQLERLMIRNGITNEEASLRIKAQMPQEEKKKYADFLVDTSRGFEDTRTQVEETHRALKVLAK